MSELPPETPRPGGVLAVLASVLGFAFGLVAGPMLGALVLALLGLTGNALGGGWTGGSILGGGVLCLFLVLGLLSSQAEVTDGSTPRWRLLSISLLGLVVACLVAALVPAGYAHVHATANKTVPSIDAAAPGGAFGAVAFWAWLGLLALVAAPGMAAGWYEQVAALRFQTGWRLVGGVVGGLVLGAVAGGAALVVGSASFFLTLGAGCALVGEGLQQYEPWRSAYHLLTGSGPAASAAGWALAAQFGTLFLVGAIPGAIFGVVAEAIGYDLHRKRIVVERAVGAAVLFLVITGLAALAQPVPWGLFVLLPVTVLVTFATGAATFGLVYGGKPWVDASLAEDRVGAIVLAGVCGLILGGSLLVWWRLVGS